MKGKVLIVLFSLALAFGLLAASCDNGDFTKTVFKDDDKSVALDANFKGADGVTYKFAELYSLGYGSATMGQLYVSPAGSDPNATWDASKLTQGRATIMEKITKQLVDPRTLSKVAANATASPTEPVHPAFFSLP